jgi:hypothetical protein
VEQELAKPMTLYRSGWWVEAASGARKQTCGALEATWTVSGRRIRGQLGIQVIWTVCLTGIRVQVKAISWAGFPVVCEENVVRAHLLVVFHMKPSLFGYYEDIYPCTKQNEDVHFYIFFYRSPFDNTFYRKPSRFTISLVTFAYNSLWIIWKSII